MADVKQMKKIVTLITCESSSCHYVCQLVFGVNVSDLNLGIQVNSVESLIKSNSVGSGHVSHCWTSAFDNHLNHCFIIFKNVKHGARTRRFHV